MKDQDLLAPPTTGKSPLVVRHPISVPAVWQGSLRMGVPTSATFVPVSAGTGPGEPDWDWHPVQSASEERSAVPDDIFRSRRL